MVDVVDDDELEHVARDVKAREAPTDNPGVVTGARVAVDEDLVADAGPDVDLDRDIEGVGEAVDVVAVDVGVDDPTKGGVEEPAHVEQLPVRAPLHCVDAVEERGVRDHIIADGDGVTVVDNSHTSVRHTGF